MKVEELDRMKSVCKELYFVLKENQKFWKLYCERILHQSTLPKEYTDWKRYFVDSFLLEWDESKFENTHYCLDPNNKREIHYTNTSGWKAALSKTNLIENYLYPFRFNHFTSYSLNFFFFFFFFFLLFISIFFQ